MTKEQKTNNLILLSLALCGTLIHILLNGQYGFHRDELDFIMSGRQLAWGYVSYPPITPFFARIGLELFGELLRGLRVLPAIAQGIVMILAGLMARDMGGRRNAQIMTALAVFIAPVSLFGGTVIMYFAFDYLWWVVVAFFMVRLLATDDARYWLGIGAGIGFGMMTKYTIAFWVIGLIVAVLVSSARKYLRSKWLYLGAALALLIFLPNLIWQIQHKFISLEYLASIHARDIDWGRADDFLINQLYETTNPLSLPLWVVGLGLCFFGASMKRFRTLGWMFVVTFILFQETVKRLKQELEKAYARGDKQAVRRLSVLIMVGKRMNLASILSLWNVSAQTVYNWLDEFARYYWKSLVYRKAPGRPAGLTKTQKRQLAAWIEAGPEACGYECGCWSSMLIQDLIDRKFHVLYNRFYVCELLRNLGFSFQKARFVSDPLDTEARQHWMESEFPEILCQAKQLGASLFFGDEASFALWGSLSYTWGRRGHQPQVPTTGLRKGYKVFGAIEFFTGRLIYQGTEQRFQSDSYPSFLRYS